MKELKMILAITALLFVVNTAEATQELVTVGQAQFRQGDTTPIYKSRL